MGMMIAAMVWTSMPVRAGEALPECPYWDLFEQYGAEYCIAPELLAAIAWYESGFDPGARNGSHRGLFQLSTKWCADAFAAVQARDWHDPADNTRTACEVLVGKFEKYEEAAVVLHSFHGESVIDKDPSAYATKILDLAERYERYRGK